jgi:hypothetical protein
MNPKRVAQIIVYAERWLQAKKVCEIAVNKPLVNGVIPNIKERILAQNLLFDLDQCLNWEINLINSP